MQCTNPLEVRADDVRRPRFPPIIDRPPRLKMLLYVNPFRTTLPFWGQTAWNWSQICV